jgi:hypothetical protein
VDVPLEPRKHLGSYLLALKVDVVDRARERERADEAAGERGEEVAVAALADGGIVSGVVVARLVHRRECRRPLQRSEAARPENADSDPLPTCVVGHDGVTVLHEEGTVVPQVPLDP